MAEKSYEMTAEGIAELESELAERNTVIADEIASRLKEANALGDLSENSEFDDAKEAQAENEARINEIKDILKHAVLIAAEDISTETVSLGSVIKLKQMPRGKTQEFTILSEREQDIFKNRFSNESPIGRAVMGKRKDDVVEVKTPAGNLRYKIVAISK